MSRRGAILRIVLGVCTVSAVLAAVIPARAGESCDTGAVRVRSTMLARASACYLAKRLPDAIAVYRGWLAANPSDRAVRVELARLLSETNDLAGAEAEYDHLLADGGTDTDRRALRRARADVRAWRGELAPAIAEYRALVAADPGDAGALLGLGLALQWNGRLVEAETALRAAVAADPQSIEATKALQALVASPAYRAMQADADRRAHPDDASRWIDAADAMRADAQLSVAETLLTTARERWPRDDRFRTRLSTLQAERKARNAEHVTALRAALARNPDDDASRSALAAALAEEGDLDGAIELYTAHLERHPDDTATRRQLARTLSWSGRMRPALALYDDLVAAAPHDTELRLEQASVLAWDGQLTESARALGPLRGVAPARVERMLGDLHRWGGARAAAARHYRAAVLLGDGGEDARAGAQYLAEQTDVAEAAPTFSAMQDSDRFNQRRVVVEARRRHGIATEVVAAVTYNDYEQRGERIDSVRGRFTLLHDVDERWRLGGTWAPAVYDEDRTRHNATAEITRTFGPERQLTAAYDHYDLIDEVLTVASADDRILSGNRGRMQGRWVLPGRVELAGTASVSGYSDGNRLVALQASLARRLLRRPGVTLRVDTGYLDYAERSDLYWDPAQYVTNGLSAIFRHEVVRGVSLQVDARVGYGQEEGQGSLERSFGAALALADVLGLTAELGYRYGETGRVGGVGDAGGGNGYVAHNGTLAVRYRFGSS
jgi:tetratricopeptide (TPR) repeat protein